MVQHVQASEYQVWVSNIHRKSSQALLVYIVCTQKGTLQLYASVVPALGILGKEDHRASYWPLGCAK